MNRILYELLYSLVAGWIVLVGAILINLIFKKIGVKTWYDFLQERKAKWFEYILLFIVYPFLLGLLAYVGIILALNYLPQPDPVYITY